MFKFQWQHAFRSLFAAASSTGIKIYWRIRFWSYLLAAK